MSHKMLKPFIVKEIQIFLYFSNSKYMIICRFNDGINMRNEGKSRIKKYTYVGFSRRRYYNVINKKRREVSW